MEKFIFDGIDKFGFPIIVALLIGYCLFRVLKYQLSDQCRRIEKLEKDNEEFRNETKHSKELLNKAFDSFNETVQTFKKIQDEVKDVKDEVKDMKDDLSDIKDFIKKK